MTIATGEDLNRAAAEAAADVLAGLYPEAAAVCTPFLHRLFAALDEGHSFVWLNDDEAVLLQTASPLVGRFAAPLVLQGRRLFLGRIWQMEADVAAEVRRLAAVPAVLHHENVLRESLAQWFGGEGSEGQQRAAALALLQNFMLITGGPGTGKTTTVAKLLTLLCQAADGRLPRIGLAAPTGKAAAHMERSLQRALGGFGIPSEIAGHLKTLKGQTLHRLLKLRPPQMQPSFHAERPLPLDVLVVDEASMLDLPLVLDLLRAVPCGCRLIFLGDEHQLPSVGVGAVLAAWSRETALDGATAGRLTELLPQHGFPVSDTSAPLAANTAKLTFSHRFGSSSGIGCLARAVGAGDGAAAVQTFADFPDSLALKPSASAGQNVSLYELQTAYWQAVDKSDIAEAFKRQSDAVVLAARREDAEAFNRRYLDYLRQQGRSDGGRWFAGMTIMVERNDYGLQVFNGDIGIVLPDHAQSKDKPNLSTALAAYFPAADGFRKISLSRLPEHGPAFAMTVHKSQGSEYRDVWLLPPPFANTAADVLDRALLYTAVTRAGSRFTFWGSGQMLAAAAERREVRRSALDLRLTEAFRASSGG